MKFPDKEPIIEYTYRLRSRYSETDRMGYIYHGRYLEYFEVARTEMIREYGLSYRDMEESGIMLPVIHSEMDYKSPVLYDEEMLITLKVYEEPAVRFKTYYEVCTEDSKKPKILGEVTLCFMNAETRKPCRAPDSFINSIRQKMVV